ncbi:putative signal transducing protein [Hymenobacter actinosclerus]|uniref:Putative signal transducing protein n=1 Tax=Hymenobacter actinosclerus TaxID=82805 RepID=A0A1I0J2Y9_9BACT|nr:DUF2007 domain-containing protein [Hymenobacter actinosclerus]SEU04157.1 Putative signal transducing protein [Hymenobacter actinosclerus]
MPADVPSEASAIVLLNSFTDSIAAHLARNQLDAAGIPCFLSNENRPYGQMMGNVGLYVRAPDVEAAREVLHPQQTHMYAVAPDVAAPEAAAEAPGMAATRCPRCHHHDVVCRHQPSPTDNLFIKLRFWLTAPEHPQCHCFHCGHDFEGE